MASEVGGDAVAPAAEAPWRSLEPASLAVNLVPDLWRTLKGAWPLFLAMLLGGPIAGLANLAFVGLFLALAVGRTFAHFLTLRYRMHEGRLEIRSGLLARQHRVIDPTRIQNVEIVQNVFQKAAGLVELRVETAGEAGIEGLLSAISEAEARRLRAELAPRPGAAGDAAHVEAGEELLAIDLLELVGYGVSAGRVGAAVLVIGAMMDAFAGLSPVAVQEAMQELAPGAALGLMLVAFAGAYAFSVASAIARWYGFRMGLSPRGLVLEAGLFTRRRVEIPRSKVQVVRVEEPLIRRLMGYGTLHIETAAVGLPGEKPVAEGIVPMATFDELPDVARHALPHLDLDPWSAPLKPPAPRALVRAMVGGTFRWIVLAGLAWWIVGHVAWLLVPIGALTGWLDWRRQGWAITPEVVISRRGFLSRETWILGRDKIQSVHLRQGPILRLNGLARVDVWAAGTIVALPDLREADAREVFVTLAALSGAEQQAHRDDGPDGAGEVGHEPGRHGVAGPGDADGAEVDRQHVEGGLAGAVHGGGDLADVGVRTVGLHDLAGQREGSGAGEGAEQRDGEGLGGEAQRARDGGEGAHEERHGAAGLEHADRGEEGDEVGDEPRRR